jgi:hypothetical protein
MIHLNVTLCNMEAVRRRLGEKYWFLRQGRRVCQAKNKQEAGGTALISFLIGLLLRHETPLRTYVKFVFLLFVRCWLMPCKNVSYILAGAIRSQRCRESPVALRKLAYFGVRQEYWFSFWFEYCCKPGLYH